MPSLRHLEPRHFRIRWLEVLLGVGLACCAAGVADNSVGTWQLNREKSQYSPGTLPFKRLILCREAVEGGVKVIIKGQRANGAAINASYTVQYGGKPVGVSRTGTSYHSVAIAQLRPSTFTAEFKSSSSRYSAFERIQVSTDGGTMYVVSAGRDARGRQFSATLVFDKK